MKLNLVRQPSCSCPAPTEAPAMLKLLTPITSPMVTRPTSPSGSSASAEPPNSMDRSASKPHSATATSDQQLPARSKKWKSPPCCDGCGAAKTSGGHCTGCGGRFCAACMGSPTAKSAAGSSSSSSSGSPSSTHAATSKAACSNCSALCNNCKPVACRWVWTPLQSWHAACFQCRGIIAGERTVMLCVSAPVTWKRLADASCAADAHVAMLLFWVAASARRSGSSQWPRGCVRRVLACVMPARGLHAACAGVCVL